MEIAAIYAARSGPKVPLSSTCLEMIASMRRTAVAQVRPTTHVQAKKNYRKQTPPRLPDNWREKALKDTHRKVREKDDPDYETIIAAVNKLSKINLEENLKKTLEVLTPRDDMFRLRVSTLLFDRGVQQCFFAPIIAEFIAKIVQVVPEMKEDIQAQVQMFDTLQDASNIIVIPASSEAGWEEAIIQWTKLKEKKRGQAVVVGELFHQKLVPVETMYAMIRVVLDDLEKTARLANTEATTEHVDHLVRFLFAVAPHVKGHFIKEFQSFLGGTRADVPSFTMKSRFKLEDALKILQSSPPA